MTSRFPLPVFICEFITDLDRSYLLAISKIGSGFPGDSPGLDRIDVGDVPVGMRLKDCFRDLKIRLFWQTGVKYAIFEKSLFRTIREKCPIRGKRNSNFFDLSNFRSVFLIYLQFEPG